MTAFASGTWASVTITLHWWFAPVALSVLAGLFFYRATRAPHPLDGVVPVLFAFVLVAAAAGATLGHFL